MCRSIRRRVSVFMINKIMSVECNQKFHLLPFGGLDTITPTALKSVTPSREKSAAPPRRVNVKHLFCHIMSPRKKYKWV